MSKQEHPTTLSERVEAFDQPVLIGNSNANAWHVPRITESGVTTICNRTSDYWRCKPLDFTRRGRRKICGHCANQTDGVGYPDSAPFRGDSQ